METVWEFYVDEAGEHRWRAKDRSNGKVLFISAEGYVDRRDAEHCARRSGWQPGPGEEEAERFAQEVLAKGGQRSIKADAKRLKKMGLRRTFVHPCRLELDPSAIETEYAVGDGGVNEEPVGVKLTHSPTGIVMASSMERSRTANLAVATRRLREAVLTFWREHAAKGITSVEDELEKLRGS